ncbi:MAG: hypothetical protein LQ337_003549 [Flavoplaca oasis]|nr:MAG: hypothetical protein LQ337_003549 [Flavoplaca oasis]
MAPSPAPQTPKEPQPRKRPARTNGGVKIAGTVIPFDDDDVDLSKGTSPTPLFPPYNPSPPAPLSATEKAQVASFLALRSRIHEGPFYTILDTNARVSKAKASSAATFDPFEGMPTYSQKYIKKRRRLPKLSTRPYGLFLYANLKKSHWLECLHGTNYGLEADSLVSQIVLKYFPRELHPFLDPANHKPSSLTTTNISKRTPRVRSTVVKKDAGTASGDEEEAGGKDPDEEGINENVDDEFDEEDDEDAGGDYNAEQYFDDGGDDAGDDEGDDGGGGGDYY